MDVLCKAERLQSMLSNKRSGHSVYIMRVGGVINPLIANCRGRVSLPIPGQGKPRPYLLGNRCRLSCAIAPPAWV